MFSKIQINMNKNWDLLWLFFANEHQNGHNMKKKFNIHTNEQCFFTKKRLSDKKCDKIKIRPFLTNI
jgi:hypothetical protein